MFQWNTFDAETVAPSAGFTPIPANEYTMVITDSTENKPTASGNGSFTELWLTVREGEYTGRKVPVRLNFDNPSAKAVEGAKREASAICRAVGVFRPSNGPTDLHNIPMLVKVCVEKRSDNGEFTNVVKGYAEVKTRSVADAQKGQQPAGTPDDAPPYKQQPAGSQAPHTGAAGW